ncbi:Putative metal-sulfur cluster biosynthesis proteins YuaD [Ruegeria sp. THAF57]|uniref:MOSC domain-containing protein n=1 Tax=Ruegeria sp. THAF57 TaxID=2744555 RepID=UPI0015DECC63|nr:sulfurase [Ruegeria sp. THAF57]CAD0184855.1 Putative metal-sulfur cluster biosynthesis proteins YuaD [Ruegeria sp. THAF57]
MPVLRETEFTGEIVWLGHVPAGQSIRASGVREMSLGFAGAAGERHEGVNRSSCVRMKNLYPQGTEIRNVRQLSVLSEDEMQATAAEMGLDALDPSYLGVSILLRGIPDFTHVPPSSRLQGPDGVTITVDMENRPCVIPGREVEADLPGHGAAFKPAAKGRRGVTAWVERPGVLKLGDRLKLFVPDQRAWAP